MVSPSSVVSNSVVVLLIAAKTLRFTTEALHRNPLKFTSLLEMKSTLVPRSVVTTNLGPSLPQYL